MQRHLGLGGPRLWALALGRDDRWCLELSVCGFLHTVPRDGPGPSRGCVCVGGKVSLRTSCQALEESPPGGWAGGRAGLSPGLPSRCCLHGPNQLRRGPPRTAWQGIHLRGPGDREGEWGVCWYPEHPGRSRGFQKEECPGPSMRKGLQTGFSACSEAPDTLGEPTGLAANPETEEIL